jgi:2-methylcitrate dehydratase PrpD
MSETDDVAAFVAGLRYQTMPDDAVQRAKRSVLDLLGCVTAGARSEWSSAYLRYIDAQGQGGDASVALVDRRYTAYHAAILNGTFAHATELSETFTRAVVHPGNVILPAVLAVAEREGCPGHDVLSAVSAGYEVLIRLGLSVGREFMLTQGMHTPATTGAFGAAVAVANLMHLDADEVRNVLGLTACLVPTSLMVAAKDDSSIKDMFEGLAAATGVMAYDLHRQGITGIADGLGSWGRSMSQTFEPHYLTDGLGTEWRISSGGLHFKERALLAMGQPSFDATRAVWENDVVDHRDICRVVVHTSRRAVLGGRREPVSTVAAKASIPFVVAVSLVHQDAIREDPHFIRTLVPALLNDPDVLRISNLVDVQVDPQIEHEFEVSWPMKFAARVEVEMADGRRLEAYEDIWPRSSTLSYADVRAKFLDVTKGLLSPESGGRIADAVEQLQDADSIRPIMDELRVGLRPAGSPHHEVATVG